MSAYEVAQLFVTAMTTLMGYTAVASKLKNYVTVEDYRVKVGSLHDQINGLREQVIRLEERAKK